MSPRKLLGELTPNFWDGAVLVKTVLLWKPTTVWVKIDALPELELGSPLKRG